MNEALARLTAALADRYRIEGELGTGGMATVYLAEDLKHHRKVAVKVMRPELVETMGSSRFLREIEIAAKLSHPNILAVHDSGEVNGILYYVMPLVEGESLPDRLKRERQLPVTEALKIAREVAEALAYAHARGIVHRDIKPANILMNAGHAMVADFGIARAAEGGGQVLTQTGLAIGTPQYMSPEQASGEPNVDGRTDIYALGCVLYEMLAGEPPFNGPTSQAIIARAMTETPRPLTETRPTMPAVVSSTVLTAMAKAPADRFANAGDMVTALTNADDLTRFASGAGVVVQPVSSGFNKMWPLAVVAVAVIAFVGWRFAAGKGSAVAAASNVAVLPFINQGPADQAYFADGIVDELRNKLARLDQLTVTASSSADQYRASTKTAVEIAKELHVDQVLTGTVSWGQGTDGKKQVRVVTELVNGSTGKVTWRDSFDADSSEALGIQGRIATAVATALGTKLQPSQVENLAGRPTQNAEAYDFYLKGRAVASNGTPGLRTAANFYEQAVALDSNFARAWGGLSGALSVLYFNSGHDPVVGRRAKEALDHLLRLANDSAFAHATAAYYYGDVVGDQVARRRELDQALRLDSNNVSALIGAAADDVAAGDYLSSLARLSRARKIDPRAQLAVAALLHAQLYLGRYDEAVQTSEELMTMPKISYNAMEWIVQTRLAQGDTASAKRVFQELLARAPMAEVVFNFGGYDELSLVFGPAERNLFFRMTPAAFDNNRAWWGESMAIAYRQQGDLVRSRAYADSALATAKQQREAGPADPQLHAMYGVMLAYTGHPADAVREAERGLALATAEAAQSEISSYVRLQLIRVYLANNQNDQAMDAIEKLVNSPFYISRGWLKVDPTFKQLRGNPRFEKMLLPPVKGATG